MTASGQTVGVAPPSALPATLHDRSLWFGILPPVAIGGIAMTVGALVPTLGAPVVAILLGLVLGQLVGQPASLKAGTTFCAKKVLQASIVLLGAGMSLGQVAQVGLAGLPVMVGTIAAALIAGRLLVRLLRVDVETGLLVTYGTTICGASAIATMSAVMGADAAAVAVSVAVIVLYNVLAAVVFPYIGQAMGLTAESFGLWAGTAVNDTSSVVAAGTSYDALLVAAGLAGGAAAAYAVVVKLTRTLAIIPLALWQAHVVQRRDPKAGRGKPWWQLVPGFLVLFLVAAAVRTMGVIPEAWTGPLKVLAHLGTAIAMAAVGMSSSFRAIAKAGWRPLALGGALWLVVAGSSLLLQWVSGTLRHL